MPGGRGTILDIAVTLNSDDSAEAVESLKSWISANGQNRYIVEASPSLLFAAMNVATDKEWFHDFWCYILANGTIEKSGY